MLDLGLAIAHHLFIFALFGILASEFVLVRPGIDSPAVRRIAALDLWYGVLAGAILIAGFTRVHLAAKGWDYYAHNPYFWAKIGTFALIGLLSVPPTIAYIRWRKSDAPPSAAHILAVRRYLWAELVLFGLLPIFAAAMARGYGE